MLPMITTNHINDDEINALSQMSPEELEAYENFLTLLDATEMGGSNDFLIISYAD